MEDVGVVLLGYSMTVTDLPCEVPQFSKMRQDVPAEALTEYKYSHESFARRIVRKAISINIPKGVASKSIETTEERFNFLISNKREEICVYPDELDITVPVGSISNYNRGNVLSMRINYNNALMSASAINLIDCYAAQNDVLTLTDSDRQIIKSAIDTLAGIHSSFAFEIDYYNAINNKLDRIITNNQKQLWPIKCFTQETLKTSRVVPQQYRDSLFIVLFTEYLSHFSDLTLTKSSRAMIVAYPGRIIHFIANKEYATYYYFIKPGYERIAAVFIYSYFSAIPLDNRRESLHYKSSTLFPLFGIEFYNR